MMMVMIIEKTQKVDALLFSGYWSWEPNSSLVIAKPEQSIGKTKPLDIHQHEFSYNDPIFSTQSHYCIAS